MAGLTIRLPLARDSRDGFRLIRHVDELTRQNFKMLLLTNPGERIMEPDFGVGLRRFLFSPKTTAVPSRIRDKIDQQISIYMPVVVLDELSINGLDENSEAINIKIFYSLARGDSSDVLEFNF